MATVSTPHRTRPGAVAQFVSEDARIAAAWPASSQRGRALPHDLRTALDYIHRNLTKSKYIFIRETERYGIGIFAAKSFVLGEVILCEDDGDYYSCAVREADVLRWGLDLSRHAFQVDHDLYLLPRGSIDDLINHCCEPSAGIRLTPSGYLLIALRNIAIGEELTYDYSTYISNPRERLVCACGSASCRRDIGPFRDLPLKTKLFYVGHDVVGAFAVEDAGPRRGQRSGLAAGAGR